MTIKKLIIALCGPMVNFILAIIFAVTELRILGIEKEFLSYSNILIGIFNLLPIYPLDGGRILKSILHIATGLENTYSYTNFISNMSIIILTMFASIIIFYVQNISILFIIGYLWYLVITENKLYNQRIRIYDIINKNKENEL